LSPLPGDGKIEWSSATWRGTSADPFRGEVNPDAQVCYVDIEPVAVLHAEVLLARGEGLAAVQADLTEVDAVLADPAVRAVIDLSQPTGIIFAAVLHFMTADAAAAAVAEYMSRVPEGSWLILSTGHYQDQDLAGRLQKTATHTRFYNHSAADVTAMLGGLEPIRPGVCEGRRWIAGTGGEPSGKLAYPLVGAAIKPG
jgi:S-adenosyl methyltransferase